MFCALVVLLGLCVHSQCFLFWYDNHKAEIFCRPQRLTEIIASAENTSDVSIWALYVDVQSVGGRNETEAELDL